VERTGAQQQQHEKQDLLMISNFNFLNILFN